MGTKTILAAALVATVMLPFAAADIKVTANDPTSGGEIGNKTISSGAAQCTETLGTPSQSPAPSCKLNF